MSRIGKLPIKIPENVTVKIEDRLITVSGPKGTLVQKLVPEIGVKTENNIIKVENKKSGESKALHGLYRSLINNMVTGVSTGWSKSLEMTGVGYKVQLVGGDLILSVGFSHQVNFKKPEGVEFSVMEKEARITVTGADKQLVGETAAKIRKIRPPEPYKGKGIHYLGEKLKKKAGKSAKAVGMTAK